MSSHVFEIFIHCLTILFHEATPRVSLNAATNGSFTSRKMLKMRILRLLF